MYEYNITIKQPTGKTLREKVMSEFETMPEMIARSQMCWYSVGTVFEVNGKSFRKIHIDDAIKGYAELEEGMI